MEKIDYNRIRKNTMTFLDDITTEEPAILTTLDYAVAQALYTLCDTNNFTFTIKKVYEVLTGQHRKPWKKSRKA